MNLIQSAMLLLFLFELNLIQLANTSYSDMEYVINIWRSLGWKSVTILGSVSGDNSLKWYRRSSKQSLSLSVVIRKRFHHITQDICSFEGYVVILRDLETLDNILRCRRRADQAMVILEGCDLQGFKTKFQNFNKTRSFYRVTNGSLYHEMTFREHNVVLENKFYCDINKCTPDREKYDFQGLSISGETLNWKPWLSLYDCSAHEKCNTRGILSDVMDILASQNNFTWFVTKADSWGTKTLSNGSYGGLLGKLVRDELDLPLSIWVSTYERHDLMDITNGVFDSQYAVIINKGVQPIDMTLFMQPLTLNSWLALGFIVIIIFLALYIPSYLSPRSYNGSASQKISLLSSWVFFIFINGIYGGALTMFFTSSLGLPFHSLHEAMEHFPEWKLVQIKGSEHFIQNKLTKKPSVYNDYWDYIHTEEGKRLIVDNKTAILKFLAQPGYYYYGAEIAQLEKVQGQLLITNMELQTLNIEHTNPSGIALPKYSPWARHISSGRQFLP